MWKRGEADAARSTMERHQGQTGFARGMVERALAELDLAKGRWDQAIHHAQYEMAGYGRPWALYIQAKAYQGKGDTAREREAWRHLVSIGREADDDIPRLREAREALARLDG